MQLHVKELSEALERIAAGLPDGDTGPVVEFKVLVEGKCLYTIRAEGTAGGVRRRIAELQRSARRFGNGKTKAPARTARAGQYAWWSTSRPRKPDSETLRLFAEDGEEDNIENYLALFG